MPQRSPEHKILLLEDDHMDVEDVSKVLLRINPRLDILALRTEHEFRSALAGFQQTPPDLCIFDMRFPWTVVSRGMPHVPDEVKVGGFKLAGLRCQQLLHSQEGTTEIPVIFWSAVESEEIIGIYKGRLSQNVTLVQKSSDFRQLTAAIQRILTL